MKDWLEALSRGKQIALTVLFIHFVFLLYLWADNFIKSPQVKKQKMIVHTSSLAVPIIKKTESIVKSIPSTNPSSKTPSAKLRQIKEQPIKIKPKKPPVHKSIESLKNAQINSQKSILQKIETDLISLSTKQPLTNKEEIAIPIFKENSFIDPLKDSPQEDLSIRECIIALLQDKLVLPEFGEVKIFLSIDRNGQLQSMEVIETENEKNSEFLKNQLPDLQFPCLNEATSLTIVFSNAL